MKLWKKLTAAVLMSAAILGAGMTAKPLFPSLTCAEITAQAADETVKVGDLTFTKKETYAIVYRCNSSATSVNIPAEVDGLPVTSIGEQAFYNCTNLTSVTIPDSVTGIGIYAFYGCTGLKSVKLGNGVKTIGNSAFYGCTGLTSVLLPNSVTSINTHAFYGCTGLTSITIPDSVTRIRGSAFASCTGLESVKLGKRVKSIDPQTFQQCTRLRSIVIPKSVTSIGNNAFQDCKGLTSVTIPDSVTSIGNYAFSRCSSLTGITIPNSVTSIGERMFWECTGLTSITIPNSVKSIGYEAFYKCESLRSITIPDSVTSIGDFAFEYCTGLTSVNLGDSVTSIGSSAFNWCQNLTSITIPDSVTSIGNYAFEYCRRLTSITIPDSVTSIGSHAFSDTPWLKQKQQKNPLVVVNSILIDGTAAAGSIVIPDSVTSICDSAFLFCQKLTSITIPDSVTSIGDYALYGCFNLTSITIPDGVTSIGDAAFDGCNNLTIYGYAGTYAEQYAEENNIPFFALEPKQIGDVTLSRVLFQYTGNPVKVGSFITVFDGSAKLKYGTDFTLSYSNNVNCGKNTAKVTVKGTGKYAGSSVTKNYSIAPALSTKDGKLHIEWNKVSGADGYQIQYCKNSSFTGDTLHSTSVTNGKLYCDLVTYPKSGESWCVRVRSFTNTSTGGRKYAAWSGISVLKLNKISDVELKYTAFHYKGKEIKVGKYLKVYSGNQKLVYEKDFVLEYKNNVDRGTATVTVKGIGEYAGSSVSKTYKIV